MAFKIHKMYSKDGKVKKAETMKEHSALKNQGYNHDKRRKKSIAKSGRRTNKKSNKRVNKRVNKRN
jgi:hypothetical protein